MTQSQYAIKATNGQRVGVFRHIYGDSYRADQQFTNIKRPMTAGESNHISSNDKFIAVPKHDENGAIYILPLNKPSQIPINQPLLSVHNGIVFDVDFHPFIPTIIATASMDRTLSITSFPMDGLTQNINQSHISLNGHQRKVTLCQFNPCANSILASASADKTIKIWNIEMEQNIITFDTPKDYILSMEWDYTGSQLATTSKDKELRIFDPRQLDAAMSTYSFEGAKSTKAFWIHNMGWIGATGFDKRARRQLKFWDLKDLSKPIFCHNIDQSAAVLVPYYDNDLAILFMYGKGDGNISSSQIVNDAKKLYPISEYRDDKPQKGGCFIPKRACDVWKCEINRFLKLTRDSIQPIPFIVPRKYGTDVFQQDIFPDVYGGKPCLNGFEWINNKNNDPIKITMNPNKVITKNERRKLSKQYFNFEELIDGYIRINFELKINIYDVINIIKDYYSIFRQLCIL